MKNVSFLAMGSAVAIILGQKLGAGKIEEAKQNARWLLIFTVLMCVGVGAVMSGMAFIFPRIYNTSDEIRALASGLICVTALYMPMYAFLNTSYFIIRSGGRTFITFLFDSAYLWVFSVPLAFMLAHFTNIPILPMFAMVQGMELIKCVIGYVMVVRGGWALNLTGRAANR